MSIASCTARQYEAKLTAAEAARDAALLELDAMKSMYLAAIEGNKERGGAIVALEEKLHAAEARVRELERESFPILGHSQRQAGSVPWALVAPHEDQAQRNHYQSLKRLAERGGLSHSELCAVLEDREWRSMPDHEAVMAVAEHLSRYNGPLSRISELEKQLTALRAAALSALGIDNPYPLSDVLDGLSAAANHSLQEHGCDCHGWEQDRVRAQRGHELAIAARRLLALVTEAAPAEGGFIVKTTCCGRDDDVHRFDTWLEADRFREGYLSGPGVHPDSPGGHVRSAIITAAPADGGGGENAERTK